MKVGVTGANGFVGARILAKLGERGHAVVPLVRRPETMNDARWLDLANGGDVDAITAALDGLDAVIHGAAHLPQSYADPAEARACLDVNALGTLTVLEACTRAKVGRAVALSTNLYRLSELPVDEQAPIEPTSRASFYMVSKAAGDFWANHFAEQGRLSVAVLRLASVYGPGLLRGMIPTFADALARRQPINVQGGDRYRADFVYVDDVADAVVAAVERSASGAFNIGSGVASTPLVCAELLAELLDAPSSLLDIKPAVDGPVQGFSPLAIGRASRELGFSPRTLRQGLADYVASRKP